MIDFNMSMVPLSPDCIFDGDFPSAAMMAEYPYPFRFFSVCATGMGKGKGPNMAKEDPDEMLKIVMRGLGKRLWVQADKIARYVSCVGKSGGREGEC